MKTQFLWVSLVAVFCIGCGPTAETGGEDTSAEEATSTDTDSGEAAEGSGEKAAAAGTELNPGNTTIQFVGAHVDKSKDDRVGKFEKFTGSMEVTDGKVASINVSIETASLTTAMNGLTEHLLGPDFFDVREHPEAEFKTTSIAGDGSVTVTGDMTLLGVTKSISFPAEVKTADGMTELSAEFEIDRTEFGMDYSVESIEKTVVMTITVKA